MKPTNPYRALDALAGDPEADFQRWLSEKNLTALGANRDEIHGMRVLMRWNPGPETRIQ